MHFIKSSNSFTRFKVIGNPTFSQEEYQKALSRNVFRELSGLEEESIGWVDPTNCLQPPQLDEMISEPYFKLTIRADRKRIPQALLSAHLAIEERAILEASGRKKLSVNERRELRQSVKEMLLEKSSATSTLYNILWNFSTQTCFLFSTSKAIQGHFRKLFRETFEFDLLPLTPWILAHMWAQDNNAVKILENSVPSLMQRDSL